MTEIQCNGPCRERLPATTDFFYRIRKDKEKLETTCICCRNERRQKQRESQKQLLNKRQN